MSNKLRRKATRKNNYKGGRNNKRRNKHMAIAIATIICAFIAIFILVIMFPKKQLKVSSVPNVADRLLYTANEATKEISVEEITSCSLTILEKKWVNEANFEEGYFEVNNDQYFYLKQEKETGEPITKLNVKIPKRLKNIFEISQNLVEDFVEEYFEDDVKDNILKEMNEIGFCVGDFSQSTTLQNASFVYEDNKIWCNPTNIEILEFLPDEDLILTLVHEWVHMVEHVTFEGNVNAQHYNYFYEAMTDVIAKSIYAYERLDGRGYNDYYTYAYLFLNAFEKDGIDAYFFGYDSLFEHGQLTEEKMQIFCYLTEMSGTEILSDGYSDLMAFEQMTGLTLDKMYKIAKGLLLMQ